MLVLNTPTNLFRRSKLTPNMVAILAAVNANKPQARCWQQWVCLLQEHSGRRRRRRRKRRRIAKERQPGSGTARTRSGRSALANASASRWRLAEQWWRRVCAQDHLCRMNSAQISGQEENVVLRAAVEATDTSTQQTKNFPTCLSQAQQIAATRAGCHWCTPFVLLPCTPVCFGGCSNELAMAQARAVIAGD